MFEELRSRVDDRNRQQEAAAQESNQRQHLVGYVGLDTFIYNHNHSNHRLNGSSSPVLTATSLSYGKAKNSTPRRIKFPDLIEIKFGTVDYVG